MDHRRSTRSLRTRAAAALALIMALSFWPGCTPDKRYQVLSFFFDGVPDPSLAKVPEGASVRGRSASGAPLVFFAHKPYADENCAACHVAGADRVYRPDTATVSPTVCLNCHTGVTDKYPVMHGPVAAVECLWCHAPHEADNKQLLKAPSPDICLQCHSPELLSPTPPEHLQPGANCLECHVAHGANSHGLLRAGRPTLAPTTSEQPSGGQQ